MIGVMVVSSELQDNTELEIERLGLKVTEEAEGVSGIVVLVATGGTERKMERIMKSAEVPLMLWALPDNNSLAAALEVYSAYKGRAKLLYSPVNDAALEEIKRFERVCDALREIKKKRIGLIGGISDWILTSRIEDIRRFGLDVREIGTQELLDSLRPEEVPDALKDSEPYEGLDKSLELHSALRSLVARYGLDALSIRCFDLLKDNMTACIGLALLNDEGIIAGCEGDLQALATMLIASEFSRKVWMANVARIDREKNTVIFAHCTIAPSLLASRELTTHMESNKGVAIHGPLKEKGRVTIARIGGKMDRMTVLCGEIAESDMGHRDLCRTQLEIKLDTDVNDFLENALGNHHVIVFDDISEELRDFCRFKGIEVIA